MSIIHCHGPSHLPDSAEHSTMDNASHQHTVFEKSLAIFKAASNDNQTTFLHFKWQEGQNVDLLSFIIPAYETESNMNTMTVTLQSDEWAQIEDGTLAADMHMGHNYGRVLKFVYEHAEYEMFGPMASRKLVSAASQTKATQKNQSIMMKVEPGKVRNWCVGVGIAEKFTFMDMILMGIDGIKIIVWHGVQFLGYLWLVIFFLTVFIYYQLINSNVLPHQPSNAVYIIAGVTWATCGLNRLIIVGYYLTMTGWHNGAILHLSIGILELSLGIWFYTLGFASKYNDSYRIYDLPIAFLTWFLMGMGQFYSQVILMAIVICRIGYLVIIGQKTEETHPEIVEVENKE